MASPAAVLSILVDADTKLASTKLRSYQSELDRVNTTAKKGIETRLGGHYNPEAFRAYEEATRKAQARTANRKAFRAELGANFNPAGFRAYQREIDRTRVKTEESGSRMSGVGNVVAGLGSKLMGVATLATGASLGLGMIGKASLETAVGFQSAMTLIRTQAHATQGEVDRMSVALEELGPKVGTSAEELAKGLYHLESRGLRGAAALDALKIAAEGAKVGHANLEDITRVLGAALSSAVRGTGNLRNAMGQLNSIVGAGDMRMQDLADAFSGGLLAPMKRFGVGLRDIGGALAVFGDNGIKGAAAGTKLASAIRLMAAGSPASAKQLATIGIASDQLGDDIRHHGLAYALQDLQNHLVKSGLTATQQAQVISRAFGGRQSIGISVLLGQLDKLRKDTDKVGAGGRKFGGDWRATTHTLAFQMSQVGATMHSLGAVIGKALAPIVPVLNRAAQGVLHFIQQMQAGRGVGGQFARILSTAFHAIKTVVMTVFPVVKAEFVGVFHALRFVALTVAPAVARVVTGAFRTIRTVARAVFPVVKTIVLTVFHAIATAVRILVASFEVSWALLQPPIQVFINVLKYMWNVVVRPIFGAIAWTIRNVVVPAFNFLKGPVVAMAGAVVGAFNWMKGVVSDVLNFVLGLISTFIHGLGTVVQAAQSLPLVGDLFDGVGSKVNDAGDAIDNLRNKIQGVSKQQVKLAVDKVGAAAAPHSRGEAVFRATHAARGRRPDAAQQPGIARASIERTAARTRSHVTHHHHHHHTARVRMPAMPPMPKMSSMPRERRGSTRMPRIPPVPSDTLGQRIARQQLRNQATGAPRTDTRATRAELVLERRGLAADRARLAQVNRTLTDRRLPAKEHTALERERLALLRGIGTTTARIHTLAGKATGGKAAGDAARAARAELVLERRGLAADRAQLSRVNRTLTDRQLPAKEHAALERERTALLRGIGTATARIHELAGKAAGKAAGDATSRATRNAGHEAGKAAGTAAGKAVASALPGWISRLATIPSQTTGRQIQMQQLQNRAAAASNAGSTGGEAKANKSELKLEKQWLAADQAQLRRINRALAKRGLSRKERAALIQDKLALLQEIGTVLSSIGQTSQSIADGGTGAGSSGGGGGSFDLAPTGGQVTLPTAYDVRRSMDGRVPIVHHHHHNHQRVHLHVHRGADHRPVVDAIEKQVGSTIHARMRAAGQRGI